MLSFIVTTYNRPKLLKDCLRSITMQTDPRWEVLLADDNSSDLYTERFCRAFAMQNPSHRVFYWNSQVPEPLRRELVRFAYNINTMAKVAHGDYLMYLCDDVEIKPELTQIVHDFFEAHPKVNAGYVGQVLIDADYITGERTSDRYDLRINPSFGQPLHQAFCAVDHSQVVHRKEYFSNWAVQPEHWHHADGLFFDDLIKRAGPLQPIFHPESEPLVVYKVTDSSMCRQDVDAALNRLRAAANTVSDS